MREPPSLEGQLSRLAHGELQDVKRRLAEHDIKHEALEEARSGGLLFPQGEPRPEGGAGEEASASSPAKRRGTASAGESAETSGNFQDRLVQAMEMKFRDQKTDLEARANVKMEKLERRLELRRREMGRICLFLRPRKTTV